jgi:hypothetical protein
MDAGVLPTKAPSISISAAVGLEEISNTDTTVVLQVSNADKFVAEGLSCVLRLPSRKGCR